MKKLSLILLALPFLGLMACKNTSNKNPVANAQVAAADKDLQSKIFRGECSVELGKALVSFLASGGKMTVKSAREQYQFVGANVTRTTSYYESANCEGKEAYVAKETGSFKFDGKKRGEDQSKFIDIKYEKLGLLAATDEAAQAASEAKLCGLGDWETGKARDVTGQAGDTNCVSQKLPIVVANVYRIDNNILYFGARDAEDSERPMKADMSEPYSAQ